MEERKYKNYVKILNQELVPALGCTEPIAIAFAAAKAREVLGKMPEKIELLCSGNIIKNVKGVIVPNSGGMKGMDVAAVLGAVGGNAQQELAVSKSVQDSDIETMPRLVKEGICKCILAVDVPNLYIQVTEYAGEEYALVEITDHHTNITKIEKNKEVLFEKASDEHEDDESKKEEAELTVKDIIEFANEVKI